VPAPYDENSVPAPFLCGPSEPRCPAGYEAGTTRRQTKTCAASYGLRVRRRLGFEPNGHAGHRVDDPVDAMTGFTQPGLAICRPAISVLRDRPRRDGPERPRSPWRSMQRRRCCAARILNQGGVPLADAVAVDATTVRADAHGLAKGVYYGRSRPGSGSRKQLPAQIDVTGRESVRAQRQHR